MQTDKKIRHSKYAYALLYESNICVCYIVKYGLCSKAGAIK